jgi:ABC-type Na+ efflux pump permease subunit
MSTPEPPGLIDRLRALDPERYAHRLAPAGAVLCLLAAVLGNWYGLFPAALGLSLLLVACLSRDDGLLVLGPFARTELVRAACRRKPPALWRAAYAASVFALLALVYLGVTTGYQPRGQTRARQMEQVAVTFFVIFTVIQFGYLAYLTVQLVAPVVAEERDAKRLDFLLVTDLRNREILFGKAVGRLPQLLDPVLASLPILALLPLLGGVPPGFVVAAALATFATVLGLAGVSFFCSIGFPTGQKAAEGALGMCFGYMFLSGSLWLLNLLPSVWAFPSSLGIASPVEVGDLVRAVSVGNLPAVAINTMRALSLGAEPEATIIRAAWLYSLFQFGTFALFVMLAVRHLRRAAAEPPWGEARAARPAPAGPESAEGSAGASPSRRAPRSLIRPPVWDESVMWYEMYRAPRPTISANWRKELGRYAVFGALLVPVLHLIPLAIPKLNAEMGKAFVGLAVWGMAFGAMMGAAAWAGSSVAREREKGTLEALILTGLGCREILRQKWRGCVAGLNGLYGTILGAMAAGLLSLSLHPLAAIVILVTTPVHVACAASLGMFFTARAKTPVVAARNMALAVVPAFLILTVGLGILIDILGGWVGFPHPQVYSSVIAVVLPQVGTGLLTFAPVSGPAGRVPVLGPMLVGAAVGTLAYAGLAVVLWKAAVRRFEREWEVRE